MIPNELSNRFYTAAGRKKLVELYGDSETMFTGNNDDGEMVTVSFHKEHGITLKTNQNNGWVRVNSYDKDGNAAGETFAGKWTQRGIER